MAFTVVLFNEIFISGHVFIARDLLHYFLPFAVKFREAIQGNGSLLWDHSLDNGLPFAARLTPAVFYPATWLQAFLPPMTAITAGILVHFPIAASAALRVCLRYTDSVAAAWIGGLGYAFGGYALSMIGGGFYLYGAALLPVGVLAIHRLAERPSASRAAQLALITALHAICGDLQTLYWEFVLVAPCVLIAAADRRQAARTAAWGAAAGALALGIAACQLIPLAEFAGLSTRAGGIPLAQAQEWSLHPLRLLEMAVPHLFGGSMPSLTFWLIQATNAEIVVPWALAFHVGAVLLLAGLPSLAPGTPAARRAMAAWAVVAAIAALLALGTHTPFHGLAHALLPGASSFRYPEKFLVFFSLGLTVLGAAGLGALFRRIVRGGVAPRAIVSCASIAAITLAGRIALAPEIEGRAAAFAAFLASFAPKIDPTAAIDATAWALGRVFAVSTALSTVLVLSSRLRPMIAVAIIAVIAAVDLLTAGLPLKMTADPAIVASPPALCVHLPPIDDQRPSIWRSNMIIYGSDEWRGRDMIANRARDVETLLPNIGTAFCIDQVKGHEAARLAQYQKLLETLGPQGKRYMDILGADYLITPAATVTDQRYGSREVLAEIGVAVTRNGPLPYAFLSGRAFPALGGGDAIARVADPSFNYRTAVVVEGHTGLDAAATGGIATVTSRFDGAVKVTTSSDAPAILVVRESYYPGWRARVDGAVAPLYRTNAAFLGVALPQGSHLVELAFDPPLQDLASATTAIALAITMAMALLCGRRRVTDVST